MDVCSGQEVAVKTLPKVGTVLGLLDLMRLSEYLWDLTVPSSCAQIRGKLTKEKTLEKICRETDMMERLQGCKVGVLTGWWRGCMAARQKCQMSGLATC